nr:DNA polymerase I [Schaalia sp. lx-260]
MPSRVSCVNNTLLVIDGHSMAFRAFYALPAENFRADSGQHTNAVYGFFSMLVRLLESRQPTHIAVAFDVSRHSFRTEEYPQYKGTRESTPEEFKGQVEIIQQVLAAMGMTALTKEGYEADDILATLASRAAAKEMRVYLVSGDRDTFQTINEHVTVLYPGASPGELQEMTPQAVEKKYGVPPYRYPEIAAIVGETSDNLPGVPGVGPKTAAQWINAYDGLDNLLARMESVSGKRGEALREHADDVRRNRKLNHLLTDLDIGVDIDDLRVGAADSSALQSLFDMLRIGGLRKRIYAALNMLPRDAEELHANNALSLDEPVRSQEASDIFDDLTITVLHAGMETTPVKKWLMSAREQVLSLWVSGIKEPARGRADRLVLAYANHVLILEYPADIDKDVWEALNDTINAAPQLIVSDWKGTWHALHSIGMDLRSDVFDTGLAAYIVRPQQRSYTAVDVIERALGVTIEVPESPEDALFSMASSPEEPSEHQLSDARICLALLKVWTVLEKELKDTQSTDLLYSMEQPLSVVLAHMENLGIRADSAELDSQSRMLKNEEERARDAAFAVIGHEVNLSSPKQLQEVLFEELGLPKTKRTKRGYTTNAEALQDLLARTGNEFLRHLLAHRDRIKLRQMVDTLRATVDDDSRIHTSFSQVVAATGRLASSEPNLQNIPVRSADGMRIRDAFIAGEGFDALMSVDYSQIEMRIMAHLSEDAGLIEAFNSGEDLHRTMAAMVFGVSLQEVTSEQRSRIKATSYGLAYGLSSYGLSAQLHISVPEASELKDKYFERFGGVRDYLACVVERARQDGWTQTMFGRRRYLPDLMSQQRQRREMAERAALNAPIQGSAADIIKIAMIEVERKLAEKHLRSRMLLQIHDELLLEIVAEERAEVEALVREAMASPVQMSVPLEVAVGVGKTWRSAAH